jgi:hypothetical protein
MNIKVIQTIFDVLVFITMIVFIVLMFNVVKFRNEVNIFSGKGFWFFWIFPVLTAWLVFCRNRLVEYFLGQKVSKEVLSSNKDDTNAITDIDNQSINEHPERVEKDK